MFRYLILIVIGMLLGVPCTLASHMDEEGIKVGNTPSKVVNTQVVDSSTVRLRVSYLSDEDFLAQSHVEKTYKFFEDDSVVKVLVSGEHEGDKRRFEAPLKIRLKNWEHHDDQLFSFQTVLGNIRLGDEFISLNDPYKREQKFPYTEISKTEKRENVPLEQWGTVSQYITYKRSDDSLYEKSVGALYQTKTVKGEDFVEQKDECVSRSTQWRNRGLNSRNAECHQTERCKYYNLTDTTYMRDMSGANERVTGKLVTHSRGKREVIERGTNFDCWICKNKS